MIYFKTKKNIELFETTSEESKLISVLEIGSILKGEKIVKRNGKEWLKYKHESTSGYILNHHDTISISKKVKL